MTDEQAAVFLYEKHFNSCRNKRMALYGDRRMIEIIIKHFESDSIQGVISFGDSDQGVGGKRVLTRQEINPENLDMILAVVKQEDLAESYRWLYRICGNRIQLYGINGVILPEEYGEALTEEDRFVYKFGEDFSAYRKKNIVLYGKGTRTRLIIQNYPDYNIIGIMDKTEVEGVCCEKPILSYEDVIEQDTDLIIVVSRPHTRPIIYDRIHEFCRHHRILLYGENGENLFEEYGKSEGLIEKDAYFEIEERTLLRQIADHEIISFSITDTMLTYLTLVPDDLIDLVEQSGRKSGLKLCGYKEARRVAGSCGQVKKLSDIYRDIQRQTGISDEDVDRWIEVEENVRKQLLMPRYKMVGMFRYAKALGKTIYFIDDNILKEGMIKQLLRDIKIDEYAGVIISSEYNTSKRDGLFEQIKSRAKDHTWLHVGTSKYSDELPALHCGAEVFLIKSPVDMLGISSYAKARTVLDTVNDRSLLGLFISRSFNNPFILSRSEGRPRIDDLYDIAYLFVAPLITAFVIWLGRTVKEGQYDDVLFASRDGYLIQKLYSVFREKYYPDLPMGKYFLTSRRAASNSGMFTESDIIRIFTLPYEKGPSDVIKDKFGLDDETIIPYDEERYPSLLEYALAQKETIYQVSGKNRENYLSYMEKIGLSKDKRYAIFDLASSGTSQYYLDQIVPFSVEGIYLLWYDVGDEGKANLPVKALYRHNDIKTGNRCDSFITEEYLRWNYAFLEPMLTAPAPSLYGFDREGSPIYGPDERTEEERRLFELAQGAITDFFVRYMEALYIPEQGINLEIPKLLYRFKDSTYTDECCRLLDDYINRDDLGAGEFRISRL